MALLPEHSAPQHEGAGARAPRPLPLFLELVREVSERDPELARAALAGLRAYESARAAERPAPKPEIARVGGATPSRPRRKRAARDPRPLADQPAANPRPRRAGVAHRRRSRAWAAERFCSTGAERTSAPGFRVSGHVEQLLLPLLRSIGEPVALIGYCLGGTMAIAAANHDRDRAGRDDRRAVEFRELSAKLAPGPRRHVAPRAGGRAAARRASDGSAAGGILVARSRSAPCASSPSSAGSIRQARKPGASSSSRNGRTKANPSPIPPRRS